MSEPARGFDTSEFKNRLASAQHMMHEAGLAGLLLTTEPEVGYFTGFLTRFWQSPTRPWFLIVPVDRDPIAVIPSIGAQLMGQSWISDIRTWSAPNLDDDGISLLAETLREVFSPDARLGLPMGHETSLRMPLADFNRLANNVAPITFTAAAGIMRCLRMIKSEAEITKISHACSIANRAFARVTEIAGTGIALDEVFRRFQMLCLEEGADWVAYLAGAAGPSGYGDVISLATGARLSHGDVLMLDTGLVHDGYFCDFDRNFAIGQITGAAAAGHSQLMEAIDAGLSMVKPGVTASAVFHAMDKIVTGGKGHSDGHSDGQSDGHSNAGRLGHGLGMQLTEWPSLIPGDDTILEPGMVLTLEPNVQTGSNQIMVHEENIVVTANGARLLSKLAAPQLEVL